MIAPRRSRTATYDPASMSLTVGGVAIDNPLDIDGGISNGHRVWTFELPAGPGEISRHAAWVRCCRSGRRVGIPNHAWRKDHRFEPTYMSDSGRGAAVAWRWFTDIDANIERREQAMERQWTAGAAAAAERGGL